MKRSDAARGGRAKLALGGGICVVAGAAAFVVGLNGALPRRVVAATGARAVRGDVTIVSPRPDFMQLPGQGASLSGRRVVWTATTGQGQTGSEADRIYAYDLVSRRLSVAVRSQYGTTGYIGNYALIGDSLAYVDTNYSGGRFSWRIAIADLRSGHTRTVAASDRGTPSSIAPQIAFDGVHLLVLETVDLSAQEHDALAIVFTPTRQRQQVLQRVRNQALGDPALAHNTVLWTVQTFTNAAMTSKLMAYDLTRHTLHTVPVGNVTQVCASGDLVAWLTGGSAGNGRMALYSLSRHRVLSSNLAPGKAAVFPSIDGELMSWTYNNGSGVQVYSVSARRVIYNAPVVRNRIYGPTAASDRVVSWVYTMAPPRGPQRGYVVVHPVR